MANQMVPSFVEDSDTLESFSVALLCLLLLYFLFGLRSRIAVNPRECVIVITGCDSGFGLMTARNLRMQDGYGAW